jgi:hypothetical protein
MRLRQGAPFDRLRQAVQRHPFLATYTRDLTPEDLQRLFTRDTVEAYKFFTRGIEPATIANLPWHKRAAARAEAENSQGQPFEDAGLEAIVRASATDSPEALADATFQSVEQHTRDSRITDDLTILILRRAVMPEARL